MVTWVEYGQPLGLSAWWTVPRGKYRKSPVCADGNMVIKFVLIRLPAQCTPSWECTL